MEHFSMFTTSVHFGMFFIGVLFMATLTVFVICLINKEYRAQIKWKNTKSCLINQKAYKMKLTQIKNSKIRRKRKMIKDKQALQRKML